MEIWVKIIGSIIVLLIIGILHWLILWQILPQTSVKSVPSPQQPLVVSIISDSSSVNSEQNITPTVRVTKPKRIKKKQIKRRKKVNKPKKTRRRTRKKSRARHRVVKKTSIQSAHQSKPKKVAHSFSKSTNTSQKVTISNSKQNSRFANAPITSQQKTLNRVTTKKNHHTITTPLFLGGKPPYPLLSRRRGEQGTVLLKVKVNVQGKAMTIQIKQSSGFSRLDNAAVKHITNGSFKPAQRDGKPIIGWKAVRFVFQLN